MGTNSMKIDWVSTTNRLLLNPRLRPEQSSRFIESWVNEVEPKYQSQIGIATSGTTGDGMGRLVLISKSAFLVSAASVNDRLRSNKTDIWFKALPNFHVGGLGILARAHLSGATVVESLSEKWNPADFRNELAASRATLSALVPTQLFDLVKLKLKSPPGLRALILGGGRLESALYVRALELGWPVLPSYGLTECASQVATALSPQDPALVPLSHVEVRIGDQGRIEISSAALLTGHLVFSESERSLFPHGRFVDPKVDGWYATEDLGSLGASPDGRGTLKVLGRIQDFVKIGGEGVVLSRLEDQLEKLRLQFKIDGDVALLAASDERLGAMLVLLADQDSRAVQELVSRFNESVMPFERIRSVHKVAAVPRSPLGKLLRSEALALLGLRSVPES
jgi:o-succinylbenzoate---CoA ligase